MIRKTVPPAALAIVALIGVGCSNEPAENGNAGNTDAANREKAVKFAECMRDNGVSEFPDPDPSEGLTVDGVVNGSSIDPNGPAWEAAIAACEDLQPPGFTGDAPGGPSRWSTERSGEWEPLRPELVVEVRYDHVTGDRFRHGTKLLRWRPDKAPKQCTFEQMQQEARPSKLVSKMLEA